MPDFIFTVRNKNTDDTFGDTPDKTRYLIIDETVNEVRPSDEQAQDAWVAALIAATKQGAPVSDNPYYNTDVLIYIHGYNETDNHILTNHRLIKSNLKALGYKGEVVSFDWPCGHLALAYLDDRNKAKLTAMELVNSGIRLLATQQNNDCTINVHAIAHIMGAFVVREAFNDADDTKLPTNQWMLNQLVFIGGDISADAMNIHPNTDGKSDAIYNHCVRLTNYHNPYDPALAISNVKRLGTANRIGRVGLPDNVPPKCVDIDCGAHFKALPPPNPANPFYGHSFYFTDPFFYKDLYNTIIGNWDRNVLDTRILQDGKLILV